MTPVWVPLVVAALGFVSTVAGIVVTQMLAHRRESASWARETQREQERWEREDQRLTFEQRRIVYVDFYEALRRMTLLAYNHGMDLGDSTAAELPWDWQTEAAEACRRLEVYASPEVSAAALEAYKNAWSWGHGTLRGRDDSQFYAAQELVDQAQIDLLQAIRADLHVTGTPESYF
ncbi:hypothetical protein VZC37_20750 [Gordonia sp. LSe1-13]|uniref:Secreted protein n=1 Tax=Gordonia sesuvii TaxID=3116777 RepID=A0ABU7MJI9_9ACTN|nr:hypothetical protein [Gordonia sp. LSe1-13]